MKLLVSVALLLVGSVFSSNDMAEMSNVLDKAAAEADAMKSAFLRSEETHQASMTAMEKSMTVAEAADMLDKSKLATKELSEVTGMVRQGQSNLRRKAPKGYAAIDGARKMLNDFIYDTFFEYDRLIEACTSYYYHQCGQMEGCRGQIAASNFVAANARNFILDAQTIINRCEEDIPDKTNERDTTQTNTEAQLKTMKEREKVVKADLDVLTIILEMTDCDKAKPATKSGLTQLRKCTDCRTKESFVEFADPGMQEKIKKLKSKKALKMMRQTFDDLLVGAESLQALEFVQTGAKQMPVNKTNFTNPPVPRTEMPVNPCNGPTVPTAATKAGASCSLSGSPKCYKLQERFLLIQSGVQDEYNELVTNIDSLERWLKETLETLQNQIDEDKKSLDEAQEALAAAMQKEATAGETARATAAKHESLDKDLRHWMNHCSQEYIRLEGEVCALKKIRGELYKIKGGGHSAFFQDCQMSKWSPHMCMRFTGGGEFMEATCGGGWQWLTRGVLTMPEGGAKCLPRHWYRICNTQPCPVNCRLHAWTEWSKCSAECGGGVQGRLREVIQAARNGGKGCGSTKVTQACNEQACEKDCVLSDWGPWSTCSKRCDAGTQKRSKYIKVAPEGEGKCFEKWSLERLEYKKCNEFACELPDPNKALPCKSSMDVILLIDGSGSLGRKGWNAEIKLAETFAEAFEQSGTSQISVILYSGPRTWSGVWKCQGDADVDVEKICKIKKITDFSPDIKAVQKSIHDLEWPGGSTMTSLALMTAKAELTLGRKKTQSVVVAITDGRPLSYRNTRLAAKSLREVTRLVWVPVTEHAPLAQIKKWATRRWQENVIVVDSFDKLQDPATATKIVGDVCPEPYGYDHWR